MTLTDRYVAATLRSIPANSREDIERELRASIGDAIDAKVEAGSEPDAGEAAVLTDLGDPDRLAAGLTDRPLYLIGPELFLTWWRLLRVLLWIALIPGFAVLVLDILDGAAPAASLAKAVGVTVMSAVQITFWTTLVFAVLERSDRRRGEIAAEWSLDDLPTPEEGRGITLSETVFSASVTLVLIAGALLQREFSAYHDSDGAPIPLLAPDLWSFWLPALLIVLGLTLVLDIVKYALGRWTVTLAAVGTLLNIAFAAPLVWLAADDRLFQAAYFEAQYPADGAAAMSLVTRIVMAMVIAVAVWDIGEGWVKALRTRRPGRA